MFYFGLQNKCRNWWNGCRQLFSSLALDQIHDRTKLKLKTEIERNENAIELLTLIFLLFLFASRTRADDQTICLSRVGDGNWIEKILSHEKWMNMRRVSGKAFAVRLAQFMIWNALEGFRLQINSLLYLHSSSVITWYTRYFLGRSDFWVHSLIHRNLTLFVNDRV